MSISSIAEETALRLTPPATPAPSVVHAATTAAATTAAAVASGASPADAIQQGQQAVAPADIGGVSPSPLAQLVKYIPTETIALYVAVQAALGDLVAPTGKSIADANFTSRSIGGDHVRDHRGAHDGIELPEPEERQRSGAILACPYFDVLGSLRGAFLVWALSLPIISLRDFNGYNYNAWDTVIILGGTVSIATAAYVLGKNVSWQKVVDG